MAEGTKGSDVDRWRLMLEDAEREHQQAQQRWSEDQATLCTAISRLTHQLDHTEGANDLIRVIRDAVKGSVDLAALKAASEQLAHRSLQPSSAKKENSSVTDLHHLQYFFSKLSLPDSRQITLQELVGRIEKAHQPEEFIEILDASVALLQPLISVGEQNASAQVCSLMVSEIMVQLLERLSLPSEVSQRLQTLRKSLEQGVEQGAWSGVLEEIADMAADIRGKIHAERLETEQFLKGVTERLDDMDGFLSGSEKNLLRSQQEGQQLNDAVSKEMQGLHATITASKDIDNLRRDISLQLKNITGHLSVFRSNQSQQHSEAVLEVKKLKERLSKVEGEAKKLRERIVFERKQAVTDSLTGLGNRLAYDERIAHELARWRRFHQDSALVVWDVDFFKRINDSYGHAAGDNALRSIAKIVAGKIRETDFLARYGGEEFALFMPGADLAAAMNVADKLRLAVQEANFRFRGEPVQITISAGVTQLREGDTPHTLFERADQALYRAKEQGRNRVISG